MKTMAELEAESPEDFRNPVQTTKDADRDQRRWEAQRIANELLPDAPEEEQEEQEEEEEEEEEKNEI